ncbi:hypothetical protein [Caudoviricetes sp.]|nr:hypothetical protein [Caudoviricetes sp.]
MSLLLFGRARAAGTPAAAITLSADDATVTVAAGSTVDITLTLGRTAYAGSVSLSVSGLPSDVTSAFSDATLTGSESASVLTLTVDSAAAPVTADAFTITATGTGVSATVDGTCTVTTGEPTPSGTVWLDTRSGGGEDLQAASTLTGWVTSVKSSSGNSAATNLFNGSARYTDSQPTDYSTLGITPFFLSTDVDGTGTNALGINVVGYGDKTSTSYTKSTTQQAENLRLLYYIPDVGGSKPTEMYLQWKFWWGRSSTGGGFDDGVLVGGIDRSSQVGRFAMVNEEITQNNSAMKQYLCTRAPSGQACGRDDFIVAGSTTTATTGSGTVDLTTGSGNTGTATFSTSQSFTVGHLLRINPEWTLYKITGGSGTSWSIETHYDPNGAVEAVSGKAFTIMTPRNDPFQINSNNSNCAASGLSGFPTSPGTFQFDADIKTLTNQVNTITWYHKAGSTISSGDNIYRVWLNGTLIGESTTMDHGNMGFWAFELPCVIEKPRWTQTMYYWDIVGWTP